jgi:Transglycosylase-like domain
MCESKGTNEPPNEASAAGYYQITEGTWPEGGGRPPNDASKHSKAEQDAVAARLWAGGAGAGRWDCKG